MMYFVLQMLRITLSVLEMHLVLKLFFPSSNTMRVKICLYFQEFQSQHPDFSNILRLFLILAAALVFSYFICFFGDEVTTHFAYVNESIYLCDWYLFPLKMQKSLPPMIILAQKPLYIGNFGPVHCTRDTFKKVSTGILYI